MRSSEVEECVGEKARDAVGMLSIPSAELGFCPVRYYRHTHGRSLDLVHSVSFFLGVAADHSAV